MSVVSRQSPGEDLLVGKAAVYRDAVIFPLLELGTLRVIFNIEGKF